MSEEQQQESTEIKAGFYRGRGVAGSAQWGESSTGGEQVALRVQLHGGLGTYTTVLAFAGGARPYSIDRLKALGWDGSNDPALPGIDSNDVEIEISYEIATQGKNKGKRYRRVQVATGGMKFEKPLEEKRIKSFLSLLGKEAGKPASRGKPVTDTEVVDLGGDEEVPF